MRIPIDPAVEEAPPPPYTAYDADPAVAPDYAPPEPAEVSNLPVRTSLRGGYTRHLPSQESEDSHHPSAAAYFEERQFQRDYAGPDLNLLEHNIHFDHSFIPTRLPFPHPSDAYLSRDVTGQDWATFVNYLYPIQEENRKRTSKAGSDEKHPNPDHLDSPERREKIKAVIAEWNVGFFTPRLIRIIAHFEPLSIGRSLTSSARQPSPYGDSRAYEFSQYQETANRGPSAHDYTFPSTSFTGPSQAGPSNPESPRSLRRSGSKSSISSSSSSSSESSVESIASKDLDHATIPEIRTLLAAFLADPYKTNHLHKSVKELRRQLRTQHLPFSSSDPYNIKASKDEKKKFKDQRKNLKNEIKAVIKDAKNEHKAEKKFRRAARKNRREARKQERRELKHSRRDEKHARRHEKSSSRDLERSKGRELQRNLHSDPRLHRDPRLQDRDRTNPFASSPNSPPGFPIIPQARAAYQAARTASFEAVSSARQRTDAARDFAQQRIDSARESAQQRADAARDFAQLRIDSARESVQQRADAARERARQTGQKARDTASHAGRRVSNISANATSQMSGQVNGVALTARRQFDNEESARKGLAQRADEAADVLAGRERDWDGEGKEGVRKAWRRDGAGGKN